MKISPYQIAAFTEAARQRSFSKAAAAMGVTQSSVTQHVAKLEQAMGTHLFSRRREGLELTPAAWELFQISDRLRTMEQLVEEKVNDYGQVSAGHLRIAANAPSPSLLVISRYLTLYPNVRIEFTLLSWDMIMRQLPKRDIDIAIIVQPEPLDGFVINEMGATRYKAYVHVDHPLAARKTVSLRELRDEVLIVPEDGSLTQRIVREKSHALGIDLTKILKTATFPMVKEAVLHNVGVGIMLENGQFPSTSLAAIEIQEMPESYKNCIITLADKRDLRLVSSFFDVALDVADSSV
ncbi:MAG: LysR family transcriptional regulator [Alphaproteobacteria bacterium]|nr:LysR family transcriptional regulator [Alphaproteobacteria bacterium]